MLTRQSCCLQPRPPDHPLEQLFYMLMTKKGKTLRDFFSHAEVIGLSFPCSLRLIAAASL